jgi:hypothetical protein
MRDEMLSRSSASAVALAVVMWGPLPAYFALLASHNEQLIKFPIGILCYLLA